MNDRQGIPPYVIYIGIFVVVFVAALGVFLFTSQSKTKEFNLEATQYKAPTEVDQASASEAATPAAQDTIKLTIASPEDNAYISTSSVKIAGATKAGTTVTVTGGSKDIASDTNTDGSFALDIPLKEGENNLIITVFDQSGQQKTMNKTVYSIVEG
ncbi:MAG: hypothetical protein M3Q44_01880 [bacterium]|nr:hypothetical protein [bacterium]